MFERLTKDYGDLVKFPGLFGKPTLLLSFDPTAFEKVYRNEGTRPIRRGLDVFGYYRKCVRPDVFKGYAGLIGDQGDKWEKMRMTVNPIMMQPRVIKSYVMPVDEVAADFVDKIRRMRDGNGEMPNDFGHELNLWALESIGVIALEQRLGVMADVKHPEAELIIKVHRQATFYLSYTRFICRPLQIFLHWQIHLNLNRPYGVTMRLRHLNN